MWFYKLQDQALSESKASWLKEDFLVPLNAALKGEIQRGERQHVFPPTVRQHAEPCVGATEKRRGKGTWGKRSRCLSIRWSVTGNSLQPRSRSRVIESWRNLLVYLPPMNSCQTIYTASHRAGECLMHPQSIYEDFCFEDSLLGNREKTRMEEISFISAVASCEN